MPRPFRTFIGIDLGGARGKSTAVARLSLSAEGFASGAVVEDVDTRRRGRTPWNDDVLLEYLSGLGEGATIAVNAPLTLPACLRCREPVCPGQISCVDPAVVWLNTVGLELAQAEALADRDRIAAVPVNGGRTAWASGAEPATRARLVPYAHRCTAVHLAFARGIESRESLGQAAGPITARAVHLRRALASRGFALHQNLIEVSPRATVGALFGARKANGYKRDADPWETRAEIVERLASTLRFAPQSRLSREQVLRNDHCFDAVLSAYTAFLWARDDWALPAGQELLFEDDGWIFAPPA